MVTRRPISLSVSVVLAESWPVQQVLAYAGLNVAEAPKASWDEQGGAL
jgi:hypothetical protein